MIHETAKIVARAKEMLSNSVVDIRILLNEDYWKMFTVIAYHYVSENPVYEVVELYSKDGLILRIRKDEDGVEWRISHLAECTCSE